MKKPCFFIYEIDKNHKKLVGNKYNQDHSFTIRYFTDTDDLYEELRLTGEKLFEVLELVNFGGTVLKCIDMNYKIDDGVLHFFFDVNTKVKKMLPANNKFGPLEVDVNVKQI